MKLSRAFTLADRWWKLFPEVTVPNTAMAVAPFSLGKVILVRYVAFQGPTGTFNGILRIV